VAPPDPDTFLKKYYKRAEPIIIDGLLWITVLAFLLLVFVILKVFDAAGYGHDRVEALENIHYISSKGVLILFGCDMFLKLLSIAIGGNEN
jgi:hypothetical protein